MIIRGNKICSTIKHLNMYLNWFMGGCEFCDIVCYNTDCHSEHISDLLTYYLCDIWHSVIADNVCRIHHGQITANQVLLPVLEELRPVAEARASHLMVCVHLLFQPALPWIWYYLLTKAIERSWIQLPAIIVPFSGFGQLAHIHVLPLPCKYLAYLSTRQTAEMLRRWEGNCGPGDEFMTNVMSWHFNWLRWEWLGGCMV